MIPKSQQTRRPSQLLATFKAILTIVISLTLVICMFWMVSLAPLLLFIGAIATYLIFVGKDTASQKSNKAP